MGFAKSNKKLIASGNSFSPFDSVKFEVRLQPMNSMRTFFLLVSLFISPFIINAQNPSSSAGEHKACGFDEHHAHLMKTNPAYKARFIRQKAVLDSVKHAPARPERQLNQVVTIPIVVHVIHLGEQIGYQTNIPDEQILGAIDGLNERYANMNGNGADMEINFCLANRDPNGCPTSGINRIDGSSIPDYTQEGITYGGDDCGADEAAIKDLVKWPTWEYYNIWVVHDICGDIAGYAYYPNGDEYDGTVIDIASMKYGVGTLAHELGHGLNLRHTFAGDGDGECPENNDCLEDGDEICDTPPHRRGNCGINNCTTEGIWENSQHNWMSYCHPPVETGRFTQDQRTRVWNALSVEPRASLLLSQACSNEARMAITSDGSTLCRNESRLLTAEPDSGIFILHSGSGFIHNNVLTATGGTEVVVEYRIEQEACTSSVFQVLAVKPIPNSLLKSDEDTLCIGQVTTLRGFPPGGTYEVISGPGAIDSNLLTAQDAGVITLLYEKLHQGCAISDTHMVESFTAPLAEIILSSEDLLIATTDSASFQWVRCDLAYEAIPEATASTLQVTGSGSYAVVSINGICRDTSECIEVALTATHDDQKTDISIYPNPVTDVFYLDNLNPDEAEVRLYDLRGVPVNTNIIHMQGKMSIDISDLASGVYVLHVDVKGVGRLVYRVVRV